jgi:hypothetical protein
LVLNFKIFIHQEFKKKIAERIEDRRTIATEAGNVMLQADLALSF